MPDFVNIPIETDPDAITQLGFDYMESVVAGWTPADGNLDVWILSTIGRMAAETRDVASDVPLAILRYIGFYIFNFAPIDAIEATGFTNWTMQDNQGYTILDGTNVGIRDANGELIPFVTVGDFTVPALSTTATNIPIAAQEPGANGSSLGSIGSVVELIDAIDGPSSITLVAPTAGGSDAEDDSIYVSRLITYLRLLTPRPVKAQDFADLAQNTPGIFRAAAIEGLNSTTDTTGLAQTVSVFPVNEQGLAPAGAAWDAIMAAYDSYVTPLMSPNFTVIVDRPDYYTINCSFTVTKYNEFTAADVEIRTEAAVADFLSPPNWGAPSFGDVRSFVVTDQVKVNDIVGILARVPGVRAVNVVLIAVNPAGLAATDITFANIGVGAGMPIAGAIVGTVV